MAVVCLCTVPEWLPVSGQQAQLERSCAAQASPNEWLMLLATQLSLPCRLALLCLRSHLPATVPGGPSLTHDHHLQFCKESYLQTGGISTPERAQKVTTDCQSTCSHLWQADAILQRTRLEKESHINSFISNLLLWNAFSSFLHFHAAAQCHKRNWFLQSHPQ